MTNDEILRELLEGQCRIEAKLDELMRDRDDARQPAHADDPVDADYFARKTGLSRVTIMQGKAGTDAVPLYSKRPRLWLKGDVDRWVRERATRLRSPSQKACRLLDRKRK
jgi:hypothetical protein